MARCCLGDWIHRIGLGHYRRIAVAMGIPAASVLFVSDIEAELDAARTAGMQTRLAIRPGNRPPSLGHGHPEIRTFDELSGERA